MAINYTQAFNAGELSQKIDGRSNTETYKVGCRSLKNFMVLPQGGVERRAGTEFIQFAGSGATPSGTNPAEMIEFDFSSDVFYVIELGTSYAKVHYTSEGTDYVVDVTGTVPAYTSSQLRKIQFTRRYDTLIITSPDHPPQVLQRTTITPTFTISEIDYVYPPLMEENLSATTLTPSATTGTGINLLASTALFHSTQVGGVWAVENLRDGSDRSVLFEAKNTSATSSELDVSFSNWEIETSGTWKGSLVIQRSIDGGSFLNYITVVDTTGGTARNVTYASSEPEGKNTKLKMVFTHDTGTLEANLQTDSVVFKGLSEIKTVAASGTSITENARSSGVLRINCTGHGLSANDKVMLSGVTSADSAVNTALQADLTVSASNLNTNDFQVSLTGTAAVTFTSATILSSSRATADVISNLGKTTATTRWSEAAFSNFRGFSPSSEFFENRLWLAGSKDEPADIFASVFGDIYNFLPSNVSTGAIKRTIDSPEEPKWLQGKKYLFLGTSGTAVSIRSADRDALISPTNITTKVENAYGSAPLQAEFSNDVIVYVQRDGLRMRELVFNREEDTYIGQDLNILSEDITDSGIAEMYVQKEPNQFIWAIKENGDACVMTHDRGEEVRAWARIETTGEFYSGAAIHNQGEDIVWCCVKRTFPAVAWTANTAFNTGDFVNYEGKIYKSNAGADSGSTFNASNWTEDANAGVRYCIEKFHLRKDLDWYIDSGKEFNTGGSKTVNATTPIATDFINFNLTDHGYETDDVVELTNYSIGSGTSTYDDFLNNKNYRIHKLDANNFQLKYLESDDKVPITSFSLNSEVYYLRSGNGKITDATSRYSVNAPGEVYPYNDSGTLKWGIYGSGSLVAKSTATTDFPWEASYVKISDGSAYTATFADGASDSTTNVKQLSNKVSGLNHLTGSTVQVIADGNFVGTKTVDINGEATIDTYHENIKAGLQYISILQPLPIEPTLVGKLSQSRVKASSKVIVRFLKTKGASVGEAGKQLTNFSVLDTQDSMGQAIPLKTVQQRFFIGSDYDREKLIEVRQDLPYPMTVLSIASHINAEGA